MNILTFDIEDWFHILDNKKSKTENDWSSYESRIHKNTDIILELLEKNNLKATFFILGWIAKKHPEIVKKIYDLGFEIGSHTHMHQLVYSQNYYEFYSDVEMSIKILEDITGNKVESFRAPGFSIMEKNKWAFEVLYKLGIRKDSSIFPASRAHGGFPAYNCSRPSLISYNGHVLKEFPINTFNLFGNPIIFSGGGYFRICPYFLIKMLSSSSDYIMSYFHPRDFDFNQPILPGLSRFRRFKSYVGLKDSKLKLDKWLNDFSFIDLKTADQNIQWENSKLVEL